MEVKKMNDNVRKERFYKVYMGDKLVDDHASDIAVFDYIWSDDNTDEHPCHIIDEFGSEIEW